jgi:hypothetical protein
MSSVVSDKNMSSVVSDKNMSSVVSDKNMSSGVRDKNWRRRMRRMTRVYGDLSTQYKQDLPNISTSFQQLVNMDMSDLQALELYVKEAQKIKLKRFEHGYELPNPYQSESKISQRHQHAYMSRSSKLKVHRDKKNIELDEASDELDVLSRDFEQLFSIN